MVITALRAMPSSIVSSVYAQKSESSETNDFPALSDGTLNKFLRQWITSLYALQRVLVYVPPSNFPTKNWKQVMGDELGECRGIPAASQCLRVVVVVIVVVAVVMGTVKGVH